jgi:putative transcriptional regulator
MRLMQDIMGQQSNLAGSLLIAHPGLQDPNFRRSVVLLSSHLKCENALGVVINRPLNKTLGELDETFRYSDLAEIPLYEGGPVATDQMILVAWKWHIESKTFKLYFGIDEEKARNLLSYDKSVKLHGFLGYSGWDGDQLEKEVEGNAWLISPIVHEVDQFQGTELWKAIAGKMGPKMRFLADEPDNPSLN